MVIFFALHFAPWTEVAGEENLRQDADEVLSVGAPSFVFPKLNRQMWRMYSCCNVLHVFFVGCFSSPWFCCLDSTWFAELLVWSQSPSLLHPMMKGVLFLQPLQASAISASSRRLRKTLFDLCPKYGSALRFGAAGLGERCCRHASRPHANSIHAWDGGLSVGERSMCKIWCQGVTAAEKHLPVPNGSPPSQKLWGEVWPQLQSEEDQKRLQLPLWRPMCPIWCQGVTAEEKHLPVPKGSSHSQQKLSGDVWPHLRSEREHWIRLRLLLWRKTFM